VTALLANVFTLFVGIMLVVTKYLEDQAIRAGESFDTSQRDVISVIVFLANMIVLGLPLLSALAAVRIPTSATRAMACCGGKIEEEPAQDTALPGGPQPNIHLHGEIALLQVLGPRLDHLPCCYFPSCSTLVSTGLFVC
jgi:hypothetical protein